MSSALRVSLVSSVHEFSHVFNNSSENGLKKHEIESKSFIQDDKAKVVCEQEKKLGHLFRRLEQQWARGGASKWSRLCKFEAAVRILLECTVRYLAAYAQLRILTSS